ncbi:hypothetical protein ABPG75_008692 [Micractinium tetrahymenae]
MRRHPWSAVQGVLRSTLVCASNTALPAVTVAPGALLSFSGLPGGSGSDDPLTAALVALEAVTPGHHAILGLPLFVNRFVQVNNMTGEASFSALLDPPGCATLGLLDASAPAPAPLDSAPSPTVAPSPLAAPPSAASRAGGKGVAMALSAGLPLLLLALLS